MVVGARGIGSAARATVRVCGQQSTHCGQGLLLKVDGQAPVVLTCHHVIAPISADDLTVMVPDADGGLSRPIPTRYDGERSRPGRDTVVLRLHDVEPPPLPLLHAVDHETYAGNLRVIGITHLAPARLDAALSASTPLDIEVPAQGKWPDPPVRYKIPAAFRLTNTSDARPGISGGVVVCEEGVLGLIHFARGEGSEFAREAYVIPLTAWAEGWPELDRLIQPLIDGPLRNAAIVRTAADLVIGEDVWIAGYHENVFLERAPRILARDAVAGRGGTIIVGRPKSGKTRLAWELLREQSARLVVIPRQDRPPEMFEAAGLSGRHVTVFFDDLHRIALTADPMEWQRRLEASTGQTCWLLATSRDGEEWKQVQRGRTADILQQVGVVFVSRNSQGGTDLTRDEGLRLAAELGVSEDEFDNRFDGTPGSLTLDLQDMRRRYIELQETERGGVAMNRLLDAAKLLHAGGQPRFALRVLREVAERIRGDGRMSDERWSDLQRFTYEWGFGESDRDKGEFLTYLPYLEECVEYQPATEEVAALHPILQMTGDVQGLSHLGGALNDRQAFDLAEHAFRAAIAGGASATYLGLGDSLANQAGREDEAEQAFRQAIGCGETLAWARLGDLLAEQPGREGDAEEAFGRAIALGGIDMISAAGSLGNLLADQPGREMEAEAAYRQSIDAGWWLNYISLGSLLANQPGREAEAEAAYRSMIAHPGGEVGYWPLGDLLLKQPGREREAEEIQRRFVETLGWPMAYQGLGVALSLQPGREREAEEAFRTAVAMGQAESYRPLGDLLAAQPERADEAEDAYRQAIAAGDSYAAGLLGVLITEHPGREREAEQLYLTAIGAGHSRFNADLAFLLTEQQGREDDAEHASVEAIRTGNPLGYLMLGLVLTGQPGREHEAEQAYRDALAAGVDLARHFLGDLIAQQPGREEEAERIYRAAISAGVNEAYLGLGHLLSRRADRKPEACEALQAALNAGVDGAAEALAELCGPSASGDT